MYGKKEHPYCEPIAEALAHDVAFREWFLDGTKFRELASSSVCLWREQVAQRVKYTGRPPKYWWKIYYCHERHCRCLEMRGREIDILAVFRNVNGLKFGLHIECKHPGDSFSDNQALHYNERADCWVRLGNFPRTVLPHQDYLTILLCAADNNHAESDLVAFDHVVYFEDIRLLLANYPPG